MLLLVRHHPTAWTEAGLLQGRRDEPLLEPAVHIPALQRRLLPLRGLIAWCSSRVRTRQTAALYGWTDPYATPLLDELDFGAFEGRTRADLMAETGGRWLSAPFDTVLRPELDELEDRIDQFMALARSGQGPAIVFGHGGWIRLLAAKVKHHDRQQMNRLELKPGGTVELEL